MDIAFNADQKKREPIKDWTEAELKAEIEKHEAKIKDAKENYGEIEVRDAMLDKAEFLRYEAKDWVEAEKVFRAAYEMTGGASKKMEILFECLLMNF